MKKKNKKIAVVWIASILTISGIGCLINNGLSENSSKEEKSLKRNQALAMYIEGSDGYELSSDSTFPTKGYVLNTEKSTCRNGGTISQDPVTRALSVSVSHADQCSVYFDKIKLPPAEMAVELSQGVRTSFGEPAITDEGVYEMEDDYGTSYYYRGAVTNNYVKFGKWNENTPVVYKGYKDSWPYEYSTLEECQNEISYCTEIDRAGKDMYWRIIRVNGDGSLRIIYTGTQAYANGTKNTDMFIKTNQSWNSAMDDAKYIGWMYGGAKGTASTSKEQAQTNETDSDIKTYVDSWYKENIVDTGYAGAVADVLFCNDRSFAKNNVGSGYGKSSTDYGANERLGQYHILRPTFKCPQKNDAFTVSDTAKGNGALTYPIGLITADEIVAAGSGEYWTGNNKYYLYRPSNNAFSSLSPDAYYGSSSANIFGVTSRGEFFSGRGSGGVAPVINLSAEYAKSMVGDGTAEDPYRAA